MTKADIYSESFYLDLS